MAKTVTLSSTDLKILELFLWENPCHCGCAYPEMQNKDINCDNCKFTKDTTSLRKKLFKEGE